MKTRLFIVFVLNVSLALILVWNVTAQVSISGGGTTQRVSVASDGMQGNLGSYMASISAGGRYVAFLSEASNLVDGDTNGYEDIFVHDRQTSQTSCVSVSSSDTQANQTSGSVSISADGHYVAFISKANNLVSGDTNRAVDVFVRDRQASQTTRVSVASDGAQANEDSSSYTSISADGRYVAFASRASNLVNGDTNGYWDVFVHDRQTGQTSRVSIASDGTQANWDCHSPSISDDGRYVVFTSQASNLVSGDTNGDSDVFVHDEQAGQTTRISVASAGTQANGYSESYGKSISADGRYVVFISSAGNLVSGDTNNARDVFVHDREMGQTTRISVASDGMQGNDDSYSRSISADGRYVAFTSYASNLVGGDTNNATDVFVHDRETGQTTRVSVASDGTQGGDESHDAIISADGRYVTFTSDANNLVNGDTNRHADIFVHDRGHDEAAIWLFLPVILKND